MSAISLERKASKSVYEVFLALFCKFSKYLKTKIKTQQMILMNK